MAAPVSVGQPARIITDESCAFSFVTREHRAPEINPLVRIRSCLFAPSFHVIRRYVNNLVCFYVIYNLTLIFQSLAIEIFFTLHQILLFRYFALNHRISRICDKYIKINI